MNRTILQILQERFESNLHRHPSIKWSDVEKKLQNSKKLNILEKMEFTWWEPDIILYNTNTDEYIFVDCSPESPAGRRSLCYDQVALDGRKENKPKGNVKDMARSIGAELLTEDEYRYLQSLEAVDLKTSSWITTPESIRKLGWALFCDRRYNTVFTYHNGADSYYAARGWRWSVRI